MAKVLDGNSLAEEIKNKVKKDVALLHKYGIEVGLGLLLIGDNPASVQYFFATIKACKSVGIKAYQFKLPNDISVNQILNIIKQVNHDERIDGLLILLPLPKRINARRIINEVSPEKDVDGLGAISIGRLAAEESTFQISCKNNFIPSATSFLPCTPFGVIRLLQYYDIPLKGKHAVVVGKSLAVGKPLSLMLLAKDATVTICHRETKNLSYYTQQADILCSATGVRGLIKADMVKEGAVVVDIGINVLEDGSIVGDVEFNSVKEKVSYITPVPGGVGPVTIAMLLENTVRSAQRNNAMKNPFIFDYSGIF